MKCIPKSLSEIAAEASFTIADLAVVLATMERLFGFEYRFTGPCEGAIELVNVPVETWQKRKVHGARTEIRFYRCGEKENMKCLDHVFNNCRTSPRLTLDLTDSVDETVAKCKDRIMPIPSFISRDDVDRILRTQICMILKLNYPYYSWPRHVFGVFEGLVMRRVQLNKGRSILPDVLHSL